MRKNFYTYNGSSVQAMWIESGSSADRPLLHVVLCLPKVWQHQTTPVTGRVAGMATLLMLCHYLLLLIG